MRQATAKQIRKFIQKESRGRKVPFSRMVYRAAKEFYTSLPHNKKAAFFA